MTREANLNFIVLLLVLATAALSMLSNMITAQHSRMAAEQEVLFELPVDKLAQIRVLS